MADVFIEMQDEDFNDSVAAELKRVAELKSIVEKKINDAETRKKELKAMLYAKFKDQIALEDDTV